MGDLGIRNGGIISEDYNFGGLVLECIEADFPNQTFIGKGILFEKEIEKKRAWKKNMPKAEK